MFNNVYFVHLRETKTANKLFIYSIHFISIIIIIIIIHKNNNITTKINDCDKCVFSNTTKSLLYSDVDGYTDVKM